MSVEAQTKTITVPADAQEAPKTSRHGGTPNPRYPAEVESAQMQQVAAAQVEREPEPLEDDEDEEQAQAPPTAAEDVQRLVPDPNLPFPLADGTMVVARHLRMREFLSMLKIVTRGASMAMGSVSLDIGDANFNQSLIMLFIFAIPEAPDEASDFVRSIIDPAPPDDGWSTEEMVAAEAHLDGLMENPDLGDLVDVIETVVHKEGPDIRRLGKRLTDAMALMQRTQPKSAA
jgi:hypothetical protein